jgi:hypothetical protein
VGEREAEHRRNRGEMWEKETRKGDKNPMTEGPRMPGESRGLRIGAVAGVELKIGASIS